MQFSVDARVVPVEAFVPNRGAATAGVHVRLTEEHYSVSVEGISDVWFRGCEGTQALGVVSDGHLDGLTYTIEVEPNEEVFYHPRDRFMQVSVMDEVLHEAAEAGMFPFYDGTLELRSGDATFQVAMVVVWYPGGGPPNLGERSGEELMWDVLTTGWAPVHSRTLHTLEGESCERGGTCQQQ